MKVRKLIDSFNYAIDGIIYALRTQRNMRIHFIVALIILSACFVYDISHNNNYGNSSRIS